MFFFSSRIFVKNKFFLTFQKIGKRFEKKADPLIAGILEDYKQASYQRLEETLGDIIKNVTNQIKKLEPDAFSNLTRLEKLVLAHNQISVLQPGNFNGLQNYLTELRNRNDREVKISDHSSDRLIINDLEINRKLNKL